MLNEQLFNGFYVKIQFTVDEGYRLQCPLVVDHYLNTIKVEYCVDKRIRTSRKILNRVTSERKRKPSSWTSKIIKKRGQLTQII